MEQKSCPAFLRKLSGQRKWAWLVMWAWLSGGVASQQCLKVDACRCEMDDGSGTVDISSLGFQNGIAAFQDVMAPDGFYYSYNPCYGFSEGNCVDAAVCQTNFMDYFQTGDHSSATWSFDGINVQVFYATSGDFYRQTFVTLRCDRNAEAAIMVAQGEGVTGQYSIEVTSKCACPGVCGDRPNPDVTVEVSISAGSVMVIIFFAVLVVYLVAGIVFQRVQRQATGSDVIPNKSFWWALPGLVKDGFSFTFSCVGGRRKGYDQV